MKPSISKPSTQALLIALTTAGFGSLASQAAEPAQLMIDAGPCIRLDNASQRYACYEQQVDAALNASLNKTSDKPVLSSDVTPPTVDSQVEEAALAETTTAATRPAPSSAVNEDTFGLPEPESEKAKAVEELRSVISTLEETLPNQYLITLENGQVWRQTRPESRFRMKAGHNVRIYPTSWGNDYRLSVDELRGYIQVERIR